MSDFEAFLRWRCTDPFDPGLRHAYSQWLVLQALGMDPAGLPPPGDAGPTRLALPRGSLGLSSAAWFQSLQQPLPGAVSFALEPGSVEAWLLALLDEPDPQRASLSDLQQWRFWVVPSARLHPERRSIGLQPLRRAHGDGMPWSRLARTLDSLPL